jgi:chromosome segregation ATPase
MNSRLSTDYSNLQTTHQQVVSEKTNIERELIRLQHELQRLNESINQIETRERDRLELLHRTERDLTKESERKDQLSSQIDLYKTQLTQLDANVKQSAIEINKGNEIISKLQAEIKSQKAKLKLKNLVTLQQEKLLDERSGTLRAAQDELDMCQKNYNQVKEDLRLKINEVEKLNAELDKLKLENKENVQSTLRFYSNLFR